MSPSDDPRILRVYRLMPNGDMRLCGVTSFTSYASRAELRKFLEDGDYASGRYVGIDTSFSAGLDIIDVERVTKSVTENVDDPPIVALACQAELDDETDAVLAANALAKSHQPGIVVPIKHLTPSEDQPA